MMPLLPTIPDQFDFEAWRPYVPAAEFDERVKLLKEAYAISCKAYVIYEAHRTELESNHKGKYLYISTAHNDYVIGVSGGSTAATDTIEQGRKKFGNDESLLVKIGSFAKPVAAPWNV